MVSPGIVADVTIGTLRESGFDIEATPTRTFVSYNQEIAMEALVSKKLLCIVNGVKICPSSLGSTLSPSEVYSLEGSKYTVTNGTISRQDFKITNQLKRTPDGQIKYSSISDDILEFFPRLILSPTSQGKFIIYSPLYQLASFMCYSLTISFSSLKNS